MELFCQNSWQVKVINYFSEKAPIEMFDRVLKTSLCCTEWLFLDICMVPWIRKTGPFNHLLWEIFQEKFCSFTRKQFFNFSSRGVFITLFITSMIKGFHINCKRLKTINPLSSNLTKWSNTLKAFVASVFDHFMGWRLKG